MQGTVMRMLPGSWGLLRARVQRILQCRAGLEGGRAPLSSWTRTELLSSQAVDGAVTHWSCAAPQGDLSGAKRNPGIQERPKPRPAPRQEQAQAAALTRAPAEEDSGLTTSQQRPGMCWEGHTASGWRELIFLLCSAPLRLCLHRTGPSSGLLSAGQTWTFRLDRTTSRGAFQPQRVWHLAKDQALLSGCHI